MIKVVRNVFRPYVSSVLRLALCCAIFATGATADEPAKDSGGLAGPLTVGANSAGPETGSARRRGAVRRKRRRARRQGPAATKATPVAIPAGVIRGVPNVTGSSAAEEESTPLPPPTAPAPPRPRAPISGGVLNGKALRLTKPVYPAVARAANASGTVVVQVLIDEDGRVSEARAVSGHPLLRAAAEDAARNTMFSPTQLSGQPVKVTGVITYNFVP